MTTTDGRTNADSPVTIDPHPRIDGVRVTDANAVVGLVCWSVLVAMEILSTVELLVSLAVLVILPLGLGVVMTTHRTSRTSLVYRFAVFGHLPAAIAAVASFTFPTGSFGAVGLALPWVGVTACVAFFGL
ncbi:hypothetical protein [Haladaptatus sp. DFWS20]|uniref:hypothetical protein n=1 Tax=Haladaptatus sp. DFWS20 TaxID=3403467 RepID=UPI003EBB070C